MIIIGITQIFYKESIIANKMALASKINKNIKIVRMIVIVDLNILDFFSNYTNFTLEHLIVLYISTY